jgi:hypothetical protein
MSRPPIKQFNTTGPCVPQTIICFRFYLVKLEVEELINGKFYFILHAPRQSGKKTYLQTLTKQINKKGDFYALYCSLENCEGKIDEIVALTRIIAEINLALKISSIPNLSALAYPEDSLPVSDPSVLVRSFFIRLCLNR